MTMSSYNKFVLRLHRISGLLISLFFFMWFATGLVLIYHPYPNVSKEKNNEMKESLADVSSLRMSDVVDSSVRGVESVLIRQFLGQTQVCVEAVDSSFTTCLGSSGHVAPLSFSDIQTIARQWCTSPVIKVDTLKQRAQWVLYERYNRQMPIYKFCFEDDDHTELFVSGKTGQVVQHTTFSQRLWAYLGAIPHKLYFECIRKDADVWKGFLTIGGALCLVAALSGLIVGINAILIRWKRKRKLQSPYTKPLYRLHHLLGLSVGLFLIGWGISGVMSMQKVPQWLVPVSRETGMSGPDFWKADTLTMAELDMPLSTVFDSVSNVKDITLRKMGRKPTFEVTDGSVLRYFNLDGTQMVHTEAEILQQVKRLYGADVNPEIILMDSYDEYYLDYNGELPLPVYKVDLNDKDGTRFYVHKYSDKVKYQNHNRMTRKWLFSALHYLNISWLVQHRTLWTVLLWVLALTGAVVSFTGFIISLRRLLHSRKNVY